MENTITAAADSTTEEHEESLVEKILQSAPLERDLRAVELMMRAWRKVVEGETLFLAAYNTAPCIQIDEFIYNMIRDNLRCIDANLELWFKKVNAERPRRT